MTEVAQAQELIEEVQASVPENWGVDDLEEISHRIISRWSEILSGKEDEEDMLAPAVDLAVASFSPSGPNDVDAVRRFCGLTMLLSFTSMYLPNGNGSFKAVIATTHSAIDILKDYDLGVAFCSKLVPIARRKGAWKIVSLATGDMGIALTRAGRFRDALLPLKDAVELSLKEGDYNSAARYSSETARSYFELGDEENAASTWRTALAYAKRCADQELEAQILTNLRTLSSLNN